VHRVGSVVLRRYVAIEVESQTLTDSVSLEFAHMKQQMYKPTVLLLLRSIQMFSKGQFSVNKSWIVPMLPQFVLCEDKQVRGFVSDILTQHVNTLLML
jgi:hypothetical protein